MIGTVLLLVVLTALPLSALAARRLPLSNWIKMALLWVAIFGGLFVAISVWQAAASTGGALAGLFR